MQALLILFLLLNLVDAFITIKVIKGGGREVWIPLLLMKIANMYWALAILKIVAVAVVWYYGLHGLQFPEMVVIDCVYFAVVLWNFFQFEKQGSVE